MPPRNYKSKVCERCNIECKPSSGVQKFCIDCQKNYQREYKRERRKDPTVRESERKYRRKRYANDPEFRKSRLEYKRERYANDPEYRESERKYKREYARERHRQKKQEWQEETGYKNEREFQLDVIKRAESGHWRTLLGNKGDLFPTQRVTAHGGHGDFELVIFKVRQKRIYIELKTTYGEIKASQKQSQQDIAHKGGRYYICRYMEEVEKVVSDIALEIANGK